MFDQAILITKGGDSTEFSYGIGNRRIKREDANAVDGTRTTWYIGSTERIQIGAGNPYFKRYLGGMAIADYYPSTGQQDLQYLIKDHLGSIHTTTDESGLVANAEGLSFNAFGQRRTVDWLGLLSTSRLAWANEKTTRGFTGHEHADGLGIIHMNGRIYDPKLGRMLQADPFVQNPKNSQSLNRYSYVLNNPLSYTDPSGYFSLKKLWKKIRPFVAIAVMVVGMYFAPQLYALWGGLSGFIATGTVQGALIGAFSAVAFAQVGNAFQRLAYAARSASAGVRAMVQAGKVLAHGVVGGVMSYLGGGKFGHGFAAAGFTQAFAGPIGSIDAGNAGFSIERTMAAAVVGGTASELTGGKFANGALTGAFSRAFNDELEEYRTKKFQRALEYQVGRVAQNRRWNWRDRNDYSGSNIGSYIYYDDESGYFTLELKINPNQADYSAGAPYPGLFGSDFKEIPKSISALVVAEKPYSDPYLLRRQGYYQKYSELLNAPIFVIPWGYRFGDSLWRFDSTSCSFYPSGSSCQ